MQDKRIDALLGLLSGNGGQDVQQVQKQAQAGLSPEQQAMFQKALTDRSFAQQLLNTPQAAELMKKLQGNGDNHGSQ